MNKTINHCVWLLIGIQIWTVWLIFCSHLASLKAVVLLEVVGGVSDSLRKRQVDKLEYPLKTSTSQAL
jgi:hypothetical protein